MRNVNDTKAAFNQSRDRPFYSTTLAAESQCQYFLRLETALHSDDCLVLTTVTIENITRLSMNL